MCIKKDWQTEKKALSDLHIELTGSTEGLPNRIWPFPFSDEHLRDNPKMEKFLTNFSQACKIKEKAEDHLLLKLWNALPESSPLKQLGSEKFYSFWSRLNRDPLQLAMVNPEFNVVHSMILADQFSGNGFDPKSERFHIYKEHVNWIMEGSNQKYLELWSKDFIKCKNYAKKPDSELIGIISIFRSICISWNGSELGDCPDYKNIMKSVLQKNTGGLNGSNDEYYWEKKMKMASRFVPIIY